MLCEFCKIEFHKRYRQPECSLKCRLLNRIEKKDKCWEWKGTINTMGYGEMCVQGRIQRAHRLSYILFKGEIPKGIFVCHICDNPKCINPDHLWLGTAKQNNEDCLRKGRWKGRTGIKLSLEHKKKLSGPKKSWFKNGEKHPRSKLKELDIKEIRNMLNEDFTYQEIADKFGLSQSSLADIKFRRTWSHI